jgi:hypothetical protein
MWQIDHESGIPPRRPTGHLLSLENYNACLGVELAQTPRRGQAGKTGADYQVIAVDIVLE